MADVQLSIKKGIPKKTNAKIDSSKMIKDKGQIDYVVLICTIALALIGLIFIYSASSYYASIHHSDSFHYVKTQAIAMVLGLFFMVLLSFSRLEKLKNWGFLIFGISIVLLALVFIPGFGVESYGAKRWLNLGFFTIQPSEYAKFGLVIFLACYMSKKGVNTFPKMLFALMFVVAFCLLILLEPNMSITICVAVVSFVMIFFGGAKLWHLLLIFLPALACGLILILSEPYRVQRLMAFVNPWASPLDEGYQLIQSYFSLGRGGFFGVGIGNSVQKHLFLPFSESDFILSIIGEETGLFGCGCVAILFMVIVWHGFSIAVRAKDRFVAYIAAGVSTLIAVQAVMNIAVVCGAIPPTGLPLPFVSAGGSSLVAYMSAIGLLLAASRNANTKNFLFP